MSEIKPPTLDELIDILKKAYDKPNADFIGLLQRLFAKGQESDGAFYELISRTDEFFDELLMVYQPIKQEVEQRDHNSYSWYHLALLDCISGASSPKVLKILWQELQSPHPSCREAAIWNLSRIGKRNKEARKILWNARNFEFADTEETTQFRELVLKALSYEW